MVRATSNKFALFINHPIKIRFLKDDLALKFDLYAIVLKFKNLNRFIVDHYQLVATLAVMSFVYILYAATKLFEAKISLTKFKNERLVF